METEVLELSLFSLLTFSGLILLFGARELSKWILNWVGIAGGGATGAFLGFVLVPDVIDRSLEFVELTFVIGGTTLMGAAVGRFVINPTVRILSALLGFTFGVLTSLLVLGGESVIENVAGFEEEQYQVFTEFLPTAVSTAGPEQVAIISLIFGAIMGFAASRYYTAIIASLLTVTGGVIVVFTLPMWSEIIEDVMEVSVPTITYTPAILVSLICMGAAMQLLRYAQTSGARDN